MARKTVPVVAGQKAFALRTFVYATEAEAYKWATFLWGEPGQAAASQVVPVTVCDASPDLPAKRA